ncbi:hypothetical protein, partial [Candidatus Magnetaquicoccus inordinatus]|uniref:hypothetical protein n=1 Tax=Candidatus Magnetaquicoccus inordinatus TaxID=2496818 RepID=UPI001D0E5528
MKQTVHRAFPLAKEEENLLGKRGSRSLNINCCELEHIFCRHASLHHVNKIFMPVGAMGAENRKGAGVHR